ncbi:MAG: hypothetical protein ACREAC_17905, partial [Blastocatellia bacterium]
MDRFRFAIAILLSAAVMVLWPLAMHFLNPSSNQPQPAIEIPDQTQSGQNAQQAVLGGSPQPSTPASPSPIAASTPRAKKPAPAEKGSQHVQPVPATTNVAQREITVATPYLRLKFSNKGAVVTSMEIVQDRLADGTMRKIRGADGNPLELVPQNAGSLFGFPLSLKIPWTPGLADRVNSVNYQIDGLPEGQDTLELNDGEKHTITFTYSSADVTVHKSLTFY